MADDAEVLSRGGRVARGALTVYGALIFVFLFAPISPARPVQLQREPLRLVPDHRLDAALVPAGDQRLPDPRRALDDVVGGRTRDDRQRHRGHVCGLPARARAPRVPRRNSRRPDAADHDPRSADRGQPARAARRDAAPAALDDDGRDRSGRVHDAVRDAGRGRAGCRASIARSSGPPPTSARTRSSACA